MLCCCLSRNHARRHRVNGKQGCRNQYNQQIISGRRFNKMSEDTASGVRAMQVRRSLARSRRPSIPSCR